MAVTLSRRTLLSGLGSAGGFALPKRAFARSEDVSDWVAGDHARVRLIDAGPAGSGRLAGLQIQLDGNYLTYWRTPGEAGLPPTPDFSQSENLASATLRFPAPGRFDEGGAEAFGYKDEVVFPIAISPQDPDRSVTLAVALSFAVCGALCLPASATVRLGLTGPGQGPESDLVQAADRLVPVMTALGAAGPLAILAIEPAATPDRARVLARAPRGTTPALFVEAPDPWYIRADDGQKLDDGRFAFGLQVLAGSKRPSPVGLTLTLAGEAGSVQTPAYLDAAAKL